MPHGKHRKNRLGARIVEGLSELCETARSGQPLEQRYTIRTVELDLRPQEYGPADVRTTRESLGVSQAVFARIVGVSPALIESWEQGIRAPSQMACRLLDEINRDRQRWVRIVRDSVKHTRSAVRKPRSHRRSAASSRHRA